MKRRHIFMIMLLTVVLLIGAAIPAGAQSGNSVTILYPQELDTLNPMYTNMYFVAITLDLFLSPAWNFDADLNPNPVLVAEIPTTENGGISEDGRVITLTLRDDIVWSDGEPITSADFVFTYEMIIDEFNIPTSRYPYDPALGIIESIEAADERTVVVTYVEPFAPWVSYPMYVLPAHVLGPVYEDEGTLDEAAWNRAATVGSGPFVFDQWEEGSFIRFVRNENYFNGVASLDSVVVRFIPDDQALIASLLNGEGDIATFIAYSDVPALEAAGLNLQVVSSGYNEQWLFNIREGLGHPALQDIRVRQAISMAVPREQITQDLLLGLTYPANSFWEGSPYASPNVAPVEYNPEGAAQLLDETGWVDSNGNGIRDRDGVELVLRYITNQRQIRIDMQAVVQQTLRDIGVDTELVNYPSDQYFGGYAAGAPMAIGNYDIAQLSTTGAFPDPNTSIFLCSQIPTEDSPDGGNNRGICIPELDELFARQASTTDFDQRVAIFHEIDELIASTYTFLGIWYDPDLWVASGRITNVAFNGVSPYWNIAEWGTQ